MAKAVLKRSENRAVRKPASGGTKLAVVPSPEQRIAPAATADAWVIAVARAAAPHISGGTVDNVDWPALTDAIRPLVGDATISDAARFYHYLETASCKMDPDDDDSPLNRGFSFSYICLMDFILTARSATWDDLEARLDFMRRELEAGVMDDARGATGLRAALLDMSKLRSAESGKPCPFANDATTFAEWEYRDSNPG